MQTMASNTLIFKCCCYKNCCRYQWYQSMYKLNYQFTCINNLLVPVFILFVLAGFDCAFADDATNLKKNMYYSQDLLQPLSIKKHLTAEYTTKGGKKVSCCCEYEMSISLFLIHSVSKV